LGGVNRISVPDKWAQTIIQGVSGGLGKYSKEAVFTFFFPEMHILQAVAACKKTPVNIGCQGIFWDDVMPGGNFGAFTASRPAAAMAAAGCTAVIVGHCEERRSLAAVLAEGLISGSSSSAAINSILAKEIAAAAAHRLKILYCVGETAEEQEHWQDVLAWQLDVVVSQPYNCAPYNIPCGDLVIGYEPVWAVGPGKTPPDRAYIEKIAKFIKDKCGLPVVYGGGLKKENAKMLASIPEIDGGLIALTRFSGEIGFYPDEYLDIASDYLESVKWMSKRVFQTSWTSPKL